MKKIKNIETLLSHGDIESRRIVLDIAERTLSQLDAYAQIHSIAKLDGSVLHIGNKSWDLSKKRHVYVIGAGKACNAMAKAFDEILGDFLTQGIAIVKIMEDSDINHRTDIFIGGHPLPNEEGLRASEKILKLVDSSGSDDLFIVLISGGSSALMSCPVKGISLTDEIMTTDIMLKSGANIFEINAIRRHISKLNGGRLAERIMNIGAELIGVGISDGIGLPPTSDIRTPYIRYSGTPMGPDATTLDDARRVIREYGVADRLPKSVIDYLKNAGPECETPKAFPNNTYFLINTVADSCIVAKESAEALGYKAIILTSFLEGESRDAGTFFASLARQIQSLGGIIQAPCVILSCGETTTKIPDNSLIKGHGGPSQELVAGFALAAAAIPGACMFSIDSEGSDGTTMAAGGLTDSKTLAFARAHDIDLRAALRDYSTFEALSSLGDVVYTGNTGTNLCDINILYVPEKG